MQQFFEALGLSKPPRVFVSTAHVQLKGKPGARIQHALQVRTEEQRAVYAHAVSSAGWLIVKPALMQGNAVTLPLEITVPADAGECTQTILKVTANGQQRFDILVDVAAERAAETARASAAITLANAIPKAIGKSKTDFDFSERTPAASEESLATPKARFDPVKLLAHVAPLALLGLLIFGLVSLDAFSDKAQQHVQVKEEAPEEQEAKKAQEAQFKVAIQDEPDEVPNVVPVARYKIDDEPEEVFAKQPLPPVKVEIKDEPGEAAPRREGQGGRH